MQLTIDTKDKQQIKDAIQMLTKLLEKLDRKEDMEIKDMPKLDSPFIRSGDDYLVINEINPEYEWVFEDDSVTCQEKLDGTNVSIVIENGKVSRVFNRTNEIDLLDDSPVMEAVRASYKRGYCRFADGQYFGEAVGPRIQGNKYKLSECIWLPFNTYFAKHLTYKTWGKYPKDFETISAWFKDGLFPLFSASHGDKEGFVEGVVFHHTDGRMAKLRRDMFDWYEGKRH